MNEFNKPPAEEEKDQALALTGFSLPGWLKLGGWYAKSRVFLADVNSEFKKVSWPNRRQVITETAVVLLVVTILTFLVLFLDRVFTYFANLVLV